MLPPTVDVASLLPLGARSALERAANRRVSYAVRYLLTPAPEHRVVVILGEAHVKLGWASALGKELLSCFELRGVETFQRRRVAAGQWLGFLIHAPRTLLRVLSFGLVKDSTIVDAKAITTGVTEELERASAVPLALHMAAVYLAVLFSVLYPTVALQLLGVRLPGWWLGLSEAFALHCYALLPAYLVRRKPWAWLIHPVIAILTVRDAMMAEGTVQMLRKHPGARAAIVVMGRAHLAGYVRELRERHAFVSAELSP